MSSMDYRVVCTNCRHAQGRGSFRCSRCNSILEVKFDYSRLAIGKDFRKRRIDNSKYAQFFPVKKLFSRGREGGTPLVSKAYDGKRVLLKLETKNPTGSFKDRGSAVEISKAIEEGFDSICCASTGNMGISLARYSKLAGIDATIFIGADAKDEKKRKIRSFDAKVIDVDGDFNASLKIAEGFSRKTGAMVCGDYHYRKEGQKSVIFEILEQMKYRVPDFIFVPVGNATLLSAVYKGLVEFERVSLISSFPRIVAVQAEGCAPLVNAYSLGRRLSYVKPNTIADAIEVGYPTFWKEGLEALKKTDGIGIKVSDDELVEAMSTLKTMGVGAEPGGGASFAGLVKMQAENGKMLEGKSVVAVITGNN